MHTLGINAAFHDPAACLVTDGRVIAAAEEERFTHVKHGKRPTPFSAYELPYHAIEYCLREAGLDLVDVDHVAYSFDPALLLGRWVGLGQRQLQIVVLFCALPTASSAYILAARLGGNGPLVAFLISAGTAVSALTLPLWLWLLH